jgi:Co/Zn/Cd efflux system component
MSVDVFTVSYVEATSFPLRFRCASYIGFRPLQYLTNMYAERLKNQGRTMDRQTRRILEVYVPTFSVCALLGVTGWILSDAIGVIQNGDGGDDVNVVFMFAFASGNFLVDAVSTFLFWVRGKDVLVSDRLSFSVDHHSELHGVPGQGNKKTNLNMVSAMTHVGSDTMRTLSVFVAAIIATVSSASGSQCDAWAAVVVSVTIVCAVIPLVSEIYKAARR